MKMITQMWMYDAIVYIYALSLLFYFSDYAKPNQKAKRIGTGLLALVWVLQSLFFADRIVELSYMPVFTLFETLFFFAWMLVTLSLVVNFFLRIDLLMFFVNVIGFIVLALNLFSYSAASPSLPVWETKDELLFIHITLAIGSYAAFFLAAVFAGMYLFLHRKLKGKQWSVTMQRLPSLEKVEGYTFRAVAVGVPLLILSLAIGIVEIYLLGDLKLLIDPKVINSLLIIAAYSFYWNRRSSEQTTGSQTAVWNLAAFSVVLVNVLISNFSQFH